MNIKCKKYKKFRKKLLKVRTIEQFDNVIKEEEQNNLLTPEEIQEIKTEFNNTMQIALKGKRQWIKNKLKEIFKPKF